MPKKFNFVYITTNLINRKQYVGDHTTNNLEKDNYLGSGTYFKNAVKKYGRQHFVKQILEQFETKEKAFIAQEKYIQQYNTLFPNGYNMSPTGGLNVKDFSKHSEKSKIKMAAVQKEAQNRPEVKQKKRMLN